MRLTITMITSVSVYANRCALTWIVFAFVYVITGSTITGKSVFASTLIVTVCVCTVCIVAAIVSTSRAFVIIYTLSAISGVTTSAFTGPPGHDVITISIDIAVMRPKSTFINI